MAALGTRLHLLRARLRRAIDEATEFLRDKLEGGAVPVREVEEHARALGISKRTLVRARKVLGVRAITSDFGTGWSLALPMETRALTP